MLTSKNVLWITFAFCVTTGSCEIFIKKSEGMVKMLCDGAPSYGETEWKLNDIRLLIKSKHGSVRRGSLETASRALMEGTSLKISPVKKMDAGKYTCGSSIHELFVASAYASPSPVLLSDALTLTCDTGSFNGGFKGKIEWYGPNSTIPRQGKIVSVNPVTLNDHGRWSCQIENGNEMLKLEVDVSVAGPLKTSQEVNVSEGKDAELSCFLPVPNRGLNITGGSWKCKSRSNIPLPVLTKTQDSVQWNGANVNPDKVGFNNQTLTSASPFNVILKKVTRDQAGVCVCSLEFDGRKTLSADLKLNVLKRDDADNGKESGGSTGKKNMWHKRVWGLQLWIWIAVSVSSFILISLIIIVLLIHRRNKRMKMKVKKLKSMRQPLTSRNYCQCDRPVRTARQPGTGKRERPPPLPRHQYSSLNQ